MAASARLEQTRPLKTWSSSEPERLAKVEVTGSRTNGQLVEITCSKDGTEAAHWCTLGSRLPRKKY